MTTPTKQDAKLSFSPEALKLYRWIISDNDEEIAKGDLLRTKEGREVFLLAKDIELVLSESRKAQPDPVGLIASLQKQVEQLREALVAVSRLDYLQEHNALADTVRKALEQTKP